MIIFKKAADLTQHLIFKRNEGKKIGFVPTMGALHEGHISLIKSCTENNDITVCSIFINPTQFNNKEDFKHYPVTIEKDIEKLENAGCSILFLPSEVEIYPSDFQKKIYDLGSLENKLEGFFRPGHFQGVCQVVDKLIQIVEPDLLYLGAKDFQQCKVITRLLELTGNEKTQIIISETMREKDGLAMSSRNARLNDAQRKIAPTIYQELSWLKENINSTSFPELIQKSKSALLQHGFEVDYLVIANAESLKDAISVNEPLVAIVAAKIGDIRLIDNLRLN